MAGNKNDPNFQEILLSRRPFIVSNLLGIDEVTDDLIANGSLSTSCYEQIKSIVNDKDKIRRLLDFLYKRTYKDFQQFRVTLMSTGNELIASKLCLSDENNNNHTTVPSIHVNIAMKAMNDKDKEILRKLRVQFVKNMLDVESVVDYLYSEDIIKESHKSIILKNTERTKQIRSLLDILTKRHENAMPVFIRALEETGNKSLVNLIKKY